MKNRDDYLKSIYNKRDIKLRQIKKRRKTAAALTPVFLVCVAICSIGFMPASKSAAPQQNSEMFAADSLQDGSGFAPEAGSDASAVITDETKKDDSKTNAATAQTEQCQSAAGSTSPPSGFISFDAQYIRTNGGYYWDGKFPATVTINSVEELNEYYEANKDTFDMGTRDESMPDAADGSFISACGKYDEEYFKRKMLVLVVCQEGSGSTRHKVTDVEYDGNEIWVNIERRTPEIGTADMAQWHIIIELYKINPASVTVCFTE